MNSSLLRQWFAVVVGVEWVVSEQVRIAVGFPDRRAKKATEEDWSKISRVIRFIRGTIDAGLMLRCGNGRPKVTVSDAYRSHT